jgi:hypothetical protein
VTLPIGESQYQALYALAAAQGVSPAVMLERILATIVNDWIAQQAQDGHDTPEPAS